MRRFKLQVLIRVLYLLSFTGAAISSGATSSDASRLNLVGSAAMIGSRIRLTPAAHEVAGAAWYPRKQRISEGFEAAFRFQITDAGGLGSGADGFAFVLQNGGPNAIAGRGSAGGFAFGDGHSSAESPGIPRSLAVFFDTFRNRDGNDPSNNYVGIFTNGTLGQMRWPPPRLGFTRKLTFHLKDGRVHSARIGYKPPLMTIFLDGGAVLSVPVDLSSVLDETGSAYYGFTASTGQGFENHDILDWSLQPAASSNITVVQSSIRFLNNVNCIEGRNLCTPKDAFVEARGPGMYHVILPANIEWGANVPNPSARPVDVTAVQGNVCWSMKAQSAAECSGPDGAASRSNGANASQQELLAPDRNRGTLITKNEGGKTWFSINDKKYGGFAENQGFFEFDVSVR